jgi:hypothetical protein
MDSGKVVFLYSLQPPTPDPESDSESDSESNPLSKTTSNLRGVLVPLSGCVIANVPCGFLPLCYKNNWVDSFISDRGHLIPYEDLRESYDFEDLLDSTEAVFILVPVKNLADDGVEMKDGPAFGWNEYAGKFYEDDQPSPTSVWNPGRKCWDEPCDNESCICGGKKLQIDWRSGDTNFSSLLKDAYLSFRLFFDTDLGGLYCSETCKCNGCNKYYNPTNEDAKKRHELLDPDRWVRGCTKLGDSSDLYKY